ncbi:MULTISPECIES: hypothetical protein [unclassified Pseudoalteromonas]|uniref:hypothetical protein n=1 Tax=unclassified Pseudoalteromonas TaxID=194690 RepID=UPI0015F7C98B|nr:MULTISPECIES: hypothetical protein [unclassified Pseudoalteromonas]MBB1290996.1 hypothetical protein [Pseudoalteromonas sp. SR41-5]MBB1415302.1 hypothetical protein [Pseudoalteromonas sp. SG43-8]
MSGSQEIAATAVDNVDSLVAEILEGNFADNEVSLGRILAGKQEMQIVLKVVAVRENFIFDEFEDLTEFGQVSAKQDCDHDWENMGDHFQCTYADCQAIRKGA